MTEHQMIDQQKIVKQCRKWVESVIVRFNICPFAKAELEQQTINYRVVDPGTLESYVNALMVQCQMLDQQLDISTSLIIYPDQALDFDSYLDLLMVSEQVMSEAGYDGVYQLASFHPDYCFEQAEQDDAANYTNRAPYPILHLIREDHITKVLADFLKPELIPQRNIEYTRRKGLEKMAAALADCYKV
jgi:hypothetical protein